MSSKATDIAKNLPKLEHLDGSPIRALVAPRLAVLSVTVRTLREAVTS